MIPLDSHAPRLAAGVVSTSYPGVSSSDWSTSMTGTSEPSDRSYFQTRAPTPAGFASANWLWLPGSSWISRLFAVVSRLSG